MKNIYKKIFFLFAIFSFTNSFSQSSEQKNGLGLIVKADVFGPAITAINNRNSHFTFNEYTHQHFFSGTVEKQLKDRHTIQLTGTYFLEYLVHDVQYRHKQEIVSIIPEYKFFIFKNKPVTGPYIGGYLIYSQEHFKSEVYLNPYSDYYTNKLGVGLSTGYQFYIKNRIVIDTHGGIGIKKTINKNSKILYGDGQYAINIGYKF
ncbi:MAG: DUF3575 domain-containing protein [Bacteroidia bacterium]